MPFFNPLPDDIAIALFDYIPLEHYAKTACVSKSWQQLTKQALEKQIGQPMEALKQSTHEEMVKNACNNSRYAHFIIKFGLVDEMDNQQLVKLAMAHPELLFKYNKLIQKSSDIELLQIASSNKKAAEAIQAYPAWVDKVDNFFANNSSAPVNAMNWMANYLQYKSEILNIPFEQMTFSVR